jgi:hypothetical protein
MSERDAVVYAMPDGPAIPLAGTAVLASSAATRHPEQQRLAEWVDRVLQAIAPSICAAVGDLAFRLDVGLPAGVDPLWKCELENYLSPIAKRLPDRVVSVWGTEGHADCSRLRVEAARAVDNPIGARRQGVTDPRHGRLRLAPPVRDPSCPQESGRP